MSPANPLNAVLRAGEGAAFRRLERVARNVNYFAEDMAILTDDELAHETVRFRERLDRGEPLDHLIHEAFAVVREASYRTIGKRHFDVQIMGGAALHFGNVAEMRTGEGKAVTTRTLVPTPEGWRRAGDIRPGDHLFDRQGHSTTVTAVYPQGAQQVMVVSLSDGRQVECNGDHLWAVYRDDDASHQLILTTHQLHEALQAGHIYSLPHHDPVDYREAAPQADAYAAGEQWARSDDAGSLERARAWEFVTTDARDAFVRGYLSVRGQVVGGQLRLTPHPQAESNALIIQIMRSVGMSVVTSSSDDDQVIAHIVTDPTAKNRPSIVSIDATTEDAEQVCFTVDHSEHLFLVGDYVVTHNTLVATLPSYLNALPGHGVHVVTVNDYLASEQAEQMSRVHHALGLDVGCILSPMNPAQRKVEYAKDITYGTNNEFGFDYLRDNTQVSIENVVQRGHHYAIVDEIDSILIDEARTPLIISTDQPDGAGNPLRWYTKAAEIAPHLRRAERDPKTKDIVKSGHYVVDEKQRTASLTDEGITWIEDLLGIENLYDSENAFLVGYIDNALAARELYLRDKDYIVAPASSAQPGSPALEVKIVDEHTGRVLEGRRFSEGLHQSLEAKEGLDPRPLSLTMATVTLQNYFRLYDKLAGMTGTGMSEAAELHQVYHLGVIPIPTNKPPQRVDHPDRIFLNEQVKFEAVARDISQIHATGQPVLVGTTSVEKSEYLSRMLHDLHIPHNVLNAKQHGREAALVARAGCRGAVTVATNMAGRGTDIILGGNAEHMVIEALRRRGLSAEQDHDAYEAAWDELLPRISAQVEAEHQEVLELGGLFVIATERHESRRIDDQLRGRAGRQGDPGESRFYLSLTDDLMRRFNPTLVGRIMASEDDPTAPLESKLLSRAIESAQRQAESANFEIRKNILKYDDVLSAQREVIYRERRSLLVGDAQLDVYGWIRSAVTRLVDEYLISDMSNEWDMPGLWGQLSRLYRLGFTYQTLIDEYGGIEGLTRTDVIREIVSDACNAYDDQLASPDNPLTPELTLMLALSRIDYLWPLHIESMAELREGIHLRQLAQRDPLVEYQREAAILFDHLVSDIRLEAVRAFFGGEQTIMTDNAVSGRSIFEAPGEDGEPEFSDIHEDGSLSEPHDAVEHDFEEESADDPSHTQDEPDASTMTRREYQEALRRQRESA